MAKKQKTFEEAILRLEEIANLLEDSDISLDEMMKLYKESISLSEFCKERLKNAEEEITIIENN